MGEKRIWIGCDKCGNIHLQSNHSQKDLKRVKAQGTCYESAIKDFCSKCRVVTWHEMNDLKDLKWCFHCGNTQFIKIDEETDVESFVSSQTFEEWKNIKSFELECTACNQKFVYDLRSGKITEGKMTKAEKEEQIH